MSHDWTVTLRIDTSAGSANREYPLTNVANMGHAWLTVAAPNGQRADIGYYPRDGGIVGPGQLRVGDTAHQHTQDAAYTYHVSAEQAANLLARAEQIQANPGYYHGLEHNCLTVAQGLMAQAGVPVPPLSAGDGLNSGTAWKTGSTVAPIHDPSAYNSVLKATPEGQAARGEYQKSSELSGEKTGDLAGLAHHASAQATYESHGDDPNQSVDLGDLDAPGLPHPQVSVDLGDVDAPGYLHGGDPQMSTVDPGTPGHGDAGSFHHDNTDPSMSVPVGHHDTGADTHHDDQDTDASTGHH